jgi:hypothetical protein
MGRIFPSCSVDVAKDFILAIFFAARMRAHNRQKKIKVYVPKVACNREACAEIQFLNRDGSFGYATSIKREKNQASVELASILGNNNALSLDADGEYSVLTKVWFLDQDKIEHIMFSKGVVRVLVLAAKYQALACDDPQVGWNDPISDKCVVQHSTGYRTAVCGPGCEP